ncbi:hypothetical protein M426DRAFT_325893 [Hypoxylon sp. CI-4A]|nr:hypothetical protein M426DRAFT_325893 [Hypoxylon sp. CI-4A]
MTPAPIGTNDSLQTTGSVGPSPAAMTGTPTSVTPGLAPTAISWGYPHLEVFAVTNNDSNAIYRTWRNANATLDSEFLPGNMSMELVGGNVNATEAPGIAVNHRIESEKTNRTEIHINGNGTGYRIFHDSDEIWTHSDPDNWDVFANLAVDGAPAQVEYDPSVQIMRTFYLSNTDTGYAAYYFKWQGSWGDPVKIEGPALQLMTPAVVAWNRINDTRVDIFSVAKKDNHLLHASLSIQLSGWTEYEDLGGFVTTSPVAVSREPGIIDIFARGGDAGLWHLSYGNENSIWTNWTRLGNTTIQGKPDAITISSDTIDVFAWGLDGSMLHKIYNSTTKSWTPEDEFSILVEGTLSGPPRAMSDAPGSIHVFAYNNNKQLIRKTLSQSAEGSDAVVIANVPYL